MTNGKVEIGHITNPETLDYFTWSSPSKYYEVEYHEGSVFLLLFNEEEQQWADCKALQIGHEVYDDGGYSVYVFESVEALKSCGNQEQ